jgi:thiosulfate dehydrogenase [quinone] large subunit
VVRCTDVWLLAGWEKIQSPVWGTNGTAIAGFVKGALAKSSGANPSVQGWYAWFLQNVVQHNTSVFSFLVTYGEFAVGLGILLGVLTGIASGFGVLMNFNYLLAGTVSINPVLGVMGLFLVLAWRSAGQIGLDRVLLPAIGLPWQRGTLFQSRKPHTEVPQAA